MDEGYISFTQGVPLPDNYNYFYQWEIGLGRCVSDRVPVVVDVKLPLELGDSIYSCTDTLLDAAVAGPEFLWNTLDTTATTLATETGWYRILVSDNQGCTVEDSVFVEIPRDAGLPSDGILCGDVLTTAYDTTASHNWSTGDSTTTLDLSGLGPGTYSVVVQEPRGCILTDTITISGFDDFPTLELGPDVQGCDSATLGATIDSVAYQWSTGDTLPNITVSSSGIYTLTVTNENDCAVSDTVGVLIASKPQASFFIPDTVISPGLSVFFANQSSFASYLWTFGDGMSSLLANPTHVYPDTGTYCVRLVATDQQNNCGSDTVEQCFVLLRTLTNVSGQAAAKVPTLSPNPAHDQVRVVLPPGDHQHWRASLVDGTGRIIQRYRWPVSSTQVVSLAALGLSPGPYWWIFTDGRQSISIPLLIR